MVLLATLQRSRHVEFVIFEPRPLADVVLPHASKQGGEVWRFFTDKISNVNTSMLCLYISMSCSYISMLCSYISLSCCIHQCYVCIYQCHVVYINVMFVYINVVLYTSMLCLCISMSCCKHQCYIKGLYISFVRCKSSFKCHKSMFSVIHLSCNVASRLDVIRFV